MGRCHMKPKSVYLGVLCGPIFIIRFMIPGFAGEQYSWLHHSISSLSIEPQGWTQITENARSWSTPRP
jgi:hypothetical protein